MKIAQQTKKERHWLLVICPSNYRKNMQKHEVKNGAATNYVNLENKDGV